MHVHCTFTSQYIVHEKCRNYVKYFFFIKIKLQKFTHIIQLILHRSSFTIFAIKEIEKFLYIK